MFYFSVFYGANDKIYLRIDQLEFTLFKLLQFNLLLAFPERQFMKLISSLNSHICIQNFAISHMILTVASAHPFTI